MAGQRAGQAPLFDIHPTTGASIEVFYANRSMETFGRCGAGWFWWPRRRGCSPNSPAIGPFATGYAAYRHAMNGAAAISRTVTVTPFAPFDLPKRPTVAIGLQRPTRPKFPSASGPIF